MYDLSVPNRAPGRCAKCRGSGRYCWGGSVNGKPVREGPCHSCRGTGAQSDRDIKRNVAYNRHKLARLAE
jgi:DnaJ-class molecular chaperone